MSLRPVDCGPQLTREGLRIFKLRFYEPIGMEEI